MKDYFEDFLIYLGIAVFSCGLFLTGGYVGATQLH